MAQRTSSGITNPLGTMCLRSAVITHLGDRIHLLTFSFAVMLSLGTTPNPVASFPSVSLRFPPVSAETTDEKDPSFIFHLLGLSLSRL